MLRISGSTTSNYVANALGLTANTWEATLKSTNKHLMREAFRQAGDPSPMSILVETVDVLPDFSELPYPIIVKPTDRSGSRGVYKLEREDATLLPQIIRKAMTTSMEKHVLAEEFVPGTEYSVEYLSWQGKHHFLQLTLKYTTGAPCFIETGHREPAQVEPALLERIQQVVEHALDTLGLEYGASHSELKVDEDGGIKLIEVAGRMGGDCIGSDLVRYSTGYDFVKMVIQVACGLEPELSREDSSLSVESIFIMNQEDLAEYQRLKQHSPERVLKTVDFHPEKIGRITDSSNRAGCYIRTYQQK